MTKNKIFFSVSSIKSPYNGGHISSPWHGPKDVHVIVTLHMYLSNPKIWYNLAVKLFKAILYLGFSAENEGSYMLYK